MNQEATHNNINFTNKNGKTIVKLRGGRASLVFKNKKKYSRKRKHKLKEIE